MEIQLESPLAGLVAGELQTEASPAAQALVRAIRAEREGVASVLFYGSCLRKNSNEGVFDFYVLVDRYRDTYGSPLLAIGNAILPPNVFYIEAESEFGTLRAKYAVLSQSDFEKAVSPSCIHPYIWARFSQPSRLVYARDDEARDLAIRASAQAIVTLTERLGVFLPVSGQLQKFSLTAFWQEAFRRTYGAESRPESEDTIRSVYEAASERYDKAGAYALVHLEEQGWLDSVTARGSSGAYEVAMPALRRSLARLRWQISRPIARVLAILRLLKTAFTFGDWLPYAVWKVERHTGQTVELSERQRKHPLIFAWPVIWRVFLNRKPVA
jgi:hypothetical protein